jgi:hypothetical protein
MELELKGKYKLMMHSKDNIFLVEKVYIYKAVLPD